MIRVRQDNRILEITEAEKGYYLSLGYDVIDEAGNILEHSTNGRTYTAAEYNALLEELSQAKQELAEKGKGGKDGKASDPKDADSKAAKAK